MGESVIDADTPSVTSNHLIVSVDPIIDSAKTYEKTE